MITMFQCMMREQRCRDEGRKRIDEKWDQQRREDEERKQEMLTDSACRASRSRRSGFVNPRTIPKMLVAASAVYKIFNLP